MLSHPIFAVHIQPRHARHNHPVGQLAFLAVSDLNRDRPLEIAFGWVYTFTGKAVAFIERNKESRFFVGVCPLFDVCLMDENQQGSFGF